MYNTEYDVVQDIKIIGGERRAFSLWADKYNEQNTVQEKASSIARYTGSFNQIYPVITSVVIFYFISKSPDISVGTYLAFQSAFSSFMGSLLGLASTAVSLLNVIPLYDRARPILEAIPASDKEVEINKSCLFRSSGKVL